MSKIINDSLKKRFVGIVKSLSSYFNFSNTNNSKPINYYQIPRIVYAVTKNDYQSSGDHVLDLVKDLHKNKTEAVTNERMKKWNETLAAAKKKEAIT